MKLIDRHFEVFYHTEDSVIDGDFQPDVFKSLKFKVFTEAVEFAQTKGCNYLGVCNVTQQDVFLKGQCLIVRPSGDCWEVDSNSCVLI